MLPSLRQSRFSDSCLGSQFQAVFSVHLGTFPGLSDEAILNPLQISMFPEELLLLTSWSIGELLSVEPRDVYEHSLLVLNWGVSQEVSEDLGLVYFAVETHVSMHGVGH